MSSPTLSWYDAPEDIKSLLISAAQSWEDTAQSEQYMIAALAKAEVNLDVLITAYCFLQDYENLRLDCNR
jgi:hypothetical protein